MRDKPSVGLRFKAIVDFHWIGLSNILRHTSGTSHPHHVTEQTMCCPIYTQSKKIRKNDEETVRKKAEKLMLSQPETV